MTVLVSAHQLTKSFAARPLFSGVTFAVESGDRIGLIGPNGAGKSTLLGILASRSSPDAGTVSFERGLRVGFLEQVPRFDGNATILSSILEGADSNLDHWDAVARANELISKFELDSFDAEERVARLSGGWQKRVALARELIKNPDLLLLDEPTNHLDVESIVWLENLIVQAPFATITITHDRVFLQRVSNRILELDPRHEGGLLNIRGDYAAYVGIREQMINAQERREGILKNTLRRETEWLRQGAKARTTKQQARIQRAGDLKEEVADLTTRNQDRRVKIDFQAAEKNPKKLIEAEGIAKRYGSQTIFSELDLLLTPGTRLGLLGRNGSGKSTLIRVLLGQEEPSQGTIRRSEHLSVAYFDQTRQALNPEITVAKTICPSGETVQYRGSQMHIRGYLDRFLFTQGQMDMAVGRLSGGEQSRLLIAKLMLTEANVLVLDEPTNDLDIATLSILEDCLTNFDGAVILVSHDRYFLDQVANKIIAFPSSAPPESAGQVKLVTFADLGQWEAWESRRKVDAKNARDKSGGKADGNTPPAVGAKKRKLTFKEQRELELMESTIHSAEEKLASLIKESSAPESIKAPLLLAQLTKQMAETQSEIERLYARWAELDSLRASSGL